MVINSYMSSNRRLFVLGYNATLTTTMTEAPRQNRRQFELMKALARVNPVVIKSIRELCNDPSNTVIIFSGSECAKMDEHFGGLPVWLIAENGVFLKPPSHIYNSVIMSFVEYYKVIVM